MKTIFRILFLITLFSGVTLSGISRTMNKEDIPLKGGDHEDQKRSITLPIPIIASISNNQLFVDFLAPLGEVLVSISSESGSVHSVDYRITSSQTVIISVGNIAVGEQCQIEFTTMDGKRYWGNFVMK